MRTKSAKGNAALPAGFRDTSGGGDFPAAWQPKPGDVLMGTVHATRTEDAKRLKRQNAKKGEKVAIVVVADSDGVLHTVFESKGTEQFCKEVKRGDTVFLRYVKQKKIGKKRFNVYQTGIKSGKGAK
jgi:hypothetical protein